MLMRFDGQEQYFAEKGAPIIRYINPKTIVEVVYINEDICSIVYGTNILSSMYVFESAEAVVNRINNA
jgi:hypothetical protein